MGDFMKFLFVDVETTGLDPEIDTITELGMVLCDMDTKTPLVLYNELVKNPKQPELTEEITAITGITQEMIEGYGIPEVDVLRKFVDLGACADAIVAHNAPFDKGMIDMAFRKLNQEVPDFDWIDSCVDVPYPVSIKTRTLSYLAVDHGFMNPLAHRALFDCMTTFEVVKNYDAKKVYALSKSPNVWVRCHTRVPWQDPNPVGKKDNDRAKSIGFRFDGNRKIWIRQIKEFEITDVKEEARVLGLEVDLI
jgi:DNA polymerase-3 subunit epsilon